jgi:hypothetical protein
VWPKKTKLLSTEKMEVDRIAEEELQCRADVDEDNEEAVIMHMTLSAALIAR